MENLLQFLNKITEQKDDAVTPTTELIMSGILDSMNIATLIAYLEEQSGKEIPVGELDLADLETPQKIVNKFLLSESVQ